MVQFKSLFGAASLVAAMALSLPVSAQINTIDRGWYDDNGYHDPANDNYFVGTFGGTLTNFLVFNIPALGIGETYNLATLSLYNPGLPGDIDDGYFSSSPTETYTLYDYSGSIANLIGGTGSYGDLGSGTVFGSVTVSSVDNGTFVSFNLNGAGLAAVNAAAGGQIAFGGTLSTNGIGDPNAPDPVYLFGSSGSEDPTDGKTYMTLSKTSITTPVPEPGEWAAMGILAAGLGGLVARKRRRVK